MTDLIPLQSMLPARTEQQIQAQLARHVGQMQLMAHAGQAAMDEITNVYLYGWLKTTSTMITADVMKRALYGLQLTPAEEEATQAYTQEFLMRMQEINNRTAEQILAILDSVALPDEQLGIAGLLQRFIRR